MYKKNIIGNFDEDDDCVDDEDEDDDCVDDEDEDGDGDDGDDGDDGNACGFIQRFIRLRSIVSYHGL
jgi:hypothetical protein